MQTPLQLLIQGEEISTWDIAIAGGQGVEVKAVHKADSPNYLFVDVTVKPSAKAGTYYLLFTRGEEQFKYPYTIEERGAGSRERASFTTADMIYLLMPDRFANGNPDNDNTSLTSEQADRGAFFGRHGGDLQGMIDHLDYIAELGATTIWPTPLLVDNQPEESYHGYACGDYYHIDPRMGSNELYREFVAEAHERGLKVIMDVVTNHCGTAHWWMQDLPFRDWVHVFPEYTGTNHSFSTNMDPNASKYDLRLQEEGWFVPMMPDMNLDNPFVLQYFKQWAAWWTEYAGLDGFRVDTYPYNEKHRMSEWCTSVLAEYPNLNIVGECWTSSIPQLAYWQGGNANKDGFDSHLPSIMDFPLQEAICAALPTDSLRWGEGMYRVYNDLSHDFVYHDLSKMMIFVANHDTDRIGDVVRGNPDRLKLSMVLLATMRGIPQIFAGDEMMFRSADLSQGHGGLRVDFPGGWADDEVNLFDPAERPAMRADLHDFTSKLFQWRKQTPVIHNGKTLHFLSRDNTYAYFRYNDTDAVFVFINNSRGKKSIPWSHYAEITESLSGGHNVMTGESLIVDDSTIVEPRGALIVEFRRN
jgi:glycosidase